MMAHCPPCESCPVVDLCLQHAIGLKCPLDEDNNPTANTTTITKEKE